MTPDPIRVVVVATAIATEAIETIGTEGTEAVGASRSIRTAPVPAGMSPTQTGIALVI